MHKRPLHPDRIRTVEHPFGWVPCRMLNNGTIASMSPLERQLYLVLTLAADRQGISYYSEQRILQTLGCAPQELCRARNALIKRELLAYDGKTYQLLPLPHNHTKPKEPPRKAAYTKQEDVPRQRQQMPETVRDTLRQLFGPNSF